jgi:hypothetical protein
MIKEMLYFDKPEIRNIDEMLKFSFKRAGDLGVHQAVIAWSSGYTARKFMEINRQADTKLNITVVTNTRGGVMPFVISPTDNSETKKWKEEQLKKGIKGVSVSISDETCQELEKEGVKVYYVPDYMNFGEPMALLQEQALRRSKLVPFGVAEHIRPLDIDVGVDLSMFTIISQGFRVCLGCTILAVKNGFILENTLVLALGGKATGLILQASSDPKTCLVKEILGFERGSSWSERNSSHSGINSIAP